jgi:hypothetical protein
MSVTAFPNGVSSFGVPVFGGGPGVPATTGKYFFVDSTTGSNGNSGLDKDHPFADVATAISATTASKGDVIVLMPGHSETVSTTITPKAGSTIVGLGFGRNRAVFTSAASALDVFTISANNVTLQNFVIVGASASVTALLEISGTYPRFVDLELQGGVTPTSLVTVSGGADGAIWQNCRFRAAAGTAIGIVIEATAIAPDWLMTNIYFHGSSVRDVDTSFIQMSKKSLTGLIINGFYGLAVVGGDNVAGAFDFNSSTGLVDGLIVNAHVAFDTGVTGGEVFDAGGMLTSQCFFNDIASATGARFPATTAS